LGKTGTPMKDAGSPTNLAVYNQTGITRRQSYRAVLGNHPPAPADQTTFFSSCAYSQLFVFENAIVAIEQFWADSMPKPKPQ
ncbi:MAG: hypothetical protein AAFS13_10340, partial [Pseudomonadota bacterium]